jgi:uncharacterized protein
MLNIKSSGIRIWIAALPLAAILAFGTGCAKLGEPQPPEIHIPKPAVDLVAQQRADSILLTVTRPAQNTDGSAADTLTTVEVLRLREDASQGVAEKPLPDDQFVKRAASLFSVRADSFAKYLNGDSFVFQDSISLPDGSTLYSAALHYAVIFINKKNQAAGLSNRVVITPVPIPLPPTELSAEVTENFIALKWKAPSENMDGSKPPRIAGYYVYRAEGSQKLPATPVNSRPVEKPEFEDRDFQFDKTYSYAVGTVGSIQGSHAESFRSEIRSVEARDVFPPPPPENLSAIFEGGFVLLLWAPSSAADVAGYRIYRQDKKTAARILLQKELIAALSFRDTQIEPGRQYEYTIQAMDTHGNESTQVRAEVETK